VDVISHSLGGIVATIAAQKDPSRFRKIVTIASPFGGSEAADYLKWIYPRIPFFSDISTSNRNIVKCLSAGAAVSTLSIITTSGSNILLWQPNDGVVTVDSQIRLKGGIQIELQHTHHDVLQADDTVDAISAFLFKD
jgi:pimeloyl-ACP methyl ester carboxylesterase